MSLPLFSARAVTCQLAEAWHPDSPDKPGQLCSHLWPRPKSSTPACHGCWDIQGSEFLISELSGHWIQFSRDSNVWVLINLKHCFCCFLFFYPHPLKHCFMLFCCIEKLVLKLESFCPMSGSHLTL